MSEAAANGCDLATQNATLARRVELLEWAVDVLRGQLRIADDAFAALLARNDAERHS